MSKHLILMLEYDEDDQYITLQYFRNFNPSIDLLIVSSSEEVMTYLNECKKGSQKLPSLLLLNYNSTPLNAVELISEVKADKALKHIPAVVISGTVVPGITGIVTRTEPVLLSRSPPLWKTRTRRSGALWIIGLKQ